MSEDFKPAAFSNVALTLISIIVALGIEHLLGHIGDQISGAGGTARFLVAAQGVTTFLTIGAIWIAFATMLMTAAWEPRFQDFFADCQKNPNPRNRQYLRSNYRHIAAQSGVSRHRIRQTAPRRHQPHGRWA